jgi:zinc protease
MVAAGRDSNGDAVVKSFAMRTLSALILAVTLACSLSFGARAAGKVEHFTLANGLELVVVPDHRVPVVTHMIWYKVGAADETPGKSGLAHFLEHLMFKGTEKNPANRYSMVLASFGAHENAFTASDYTAYYQRVAPDKLEQVMAFEADRMTGLVLTDEVVKPELNVVLEEQNLRVANSPSARLSQQVDAALFLNHPYGRPVIGWRHEIEQLTRADAIAFYQRFYTPNNAIVVVAGDVSPDRVKAIAEETYGKIAPRAQIGPRLRPQEPTPSAVRMVTLADPRVAQPAMQRAYLVPSATTAKKGVSAALEVLANILGGGSNSRLYRTLVVDKGLAVNAGAWYQGMALDDTRFGIAATPKADVALTTLDEAVDAVVAELANNGVTAEELERAKTRLVADTIFAQDNQATLARWYGAALTTGLSVGDVQAWPERVRAVTAEEVQAAARTYLDKRRSVTGFLVRESGQPVVKTEEKRS